MIYDYIHKKLDWHTLDVNSAVNSLESNIINGLPEEEVQARTEQFGLNQLPPQKKESIIIRFFRQFHSVLIYVLLVAAVITFFLGQYLDMTFILIVTIINAAIGFVQENKAGKAIEKIKKMLSLQAQVIRSRKREEINARELTIGDIILLNPGDRVPADLRLVISNNLKIDESPLTGESVPSEKAIDALRLDISLGDRINMAYSGTTISAGTGSGIVVAIGKNTEIGKISRLIDKVKPITTPLLCQTNKLGKVISISIVIVAFMVYLFGHFFRDYDSETLLLSVIGLAVAAIPEGLPAILSIILAIGVQNMAKRKAIIRHLPSVETLGAVSVICTDKTGTLTKNEMTVKTVITGDDEYAVTGSGYSPSGDILKNGSKINYVDEDVLSDLLTCFEVCNDASLTQDEFGYWGIKGDPTEGALITLSRKVNKTEEKFHIAATIPFDSSYKYMAVLVEFEDKNVIFIKGAPEQLLKVAQFQQSQDGVNNIDINYWKERTGNLAHEGKRIMGGAYKIIDKGEKSLNRDDIKDGIIFLGIAGIIDPPRDEAIDAIKACKEAGITVKMITGDHVVTAMAIGLEMGIGDGNKALQGIGMEKMEDREFEQAAMDNDIFARTTPEQKLRIVNALQKDGLICAMTGDGVNDAPALKQADIGIAMGIKGTDVAKDASEMILVDDDFSTIVSAVEEGRRVYDNLKKTILFILPTNGAEAFLIIAAIFMGISMPLTPIQILWVNMVTSITISLALAFELIEEGTMKRKPRSPKAPLLSGYFIKRIILMSVLIGGGTLWLNIHLLEQGYATELVRTITLQTIVIVQLFHLFNCRSIRGFAFNKNFFTNKAILSVSILLIILQLSITYLPFMQDIFGTRPLQLSDWGYPLALGIAVFVIIEIEKSIMRGVDKIRLKISFN